VILSAAGKEVEVLCRKRTHLPDLKEAKDLVDGAPKPVKTGVSKKRLMKKQDEKNRVLC
jgi:large subunit ribosomal protein L7/L12